MWAGGVQPSYHCERASNFVLFDGKCIEKVCRLAFDREIVAPRRSEANCCVPRANISLE
jgi:hypothetical protein